MWETNNEISLISNKETTGIPKEDLRRLLRPKYSERLHKVPTNTAATNKDKSLPTIELANGLVVENIIGIIKMEQELKNSILKSGTTIVGVVCKDGVVMGADRQTTAGNLVMSKNTQKTVKINDYLVVSGTGNASDIEMQKKIVLGTAVGLGGAAAATAYAMSGFFFVALIFGS